MKAKGILFDLDGTLVNSLSSVERCYLKFADRHQLDHTYLLNNIHGRKAIDNIKFFLPNKSDEYIEQEFLWLEQLEAKDIAEVDEISGASNFLQQLSALNIPWGIVTSGTKPVAQARYSKLNLPKPPIFITGEMVAKTKPAPDGYLQGVKALGLEAEQCIVFEDSVAGIESAYNANCQIVGIDSPQSVNHKVGLSVHCFNDLTLTKTATNEVIIEKK